MLVREGYKQTEIGLIPEDWFFENLGNVTSEMKSGLSRKLSSEDIGLPVLRSNNISERSVNFTDLKYWYKDDPQGSNTDNYVVNDGDILVNFINSEAQIGKSAIFKKVQDRDFIFTTNLLKISASDVINNYFLHIQMKTERYSAFIKSITKPAVNQASFTTKEFQTFPIIIPPLPEQQKIVDILSTVDDKLVAIEREISATETLKKGLMQTLLCQGIGHTQFKDSPLGQIPESWDVVQLKDVVNGKGMYGIGAAAVDYDPQLFRYLRITDIDDEGRFKSTSKKSVDDEGAKNYLLQEGDIVFARTGNTTGKTYLYDKKDGDLVFAGFLIRFQPCHGVLNSRFLKAIAETQYYWKWVKATSSRTGQPGINSEEYATLKIPLPPVVEQEKIAEILSTVDNKLDTLTTQKIQYQTLKKGLMQKLLTGEIRAKVSA